MSVLKCFQDHMQICIYFYISKLLEYFLANSQTSHLDFSLETKNMHMNKTADDNFTMQKDVKCWFCYKFQWDTWFLWNTQHLAISTSTVNIVNLFPDKILSQIRYNFLIQHSYSQISNMVAWNTYILVQKYILSAW